MHDTTQRFTSRVENYRKYRPHYPPRVLEMPGHPQYEPMMQTLARIFAEHALDDRVCFSYDTRVYVGQFTIDSRRG